MVLPYRAVTNDVQVVALPPACLFTRRGLGLDQTYKPTSLYESYGGPVSWSEANSEQTYMIKESPPWPILQTYSLLRCDSLQD